MAAPPAPSVPTISPAEIQILISRTGLVLNPGQVADLVLAWRQVAGLIAGMARDRPLADDMAVTFRLPPPDATAAVQAETKPAKSSAAKGTAVAPSAPVTRTSATKVITTGKRASAPRADASSAVARAKAPAKRPTKR